MSTLSFNNLVDNLGPGIFMTGENSFDLFFQEDDVASTTYLARDGKRVVTDLIVADISGMRAINRKALLNHVVLVNNLMTRHGDFRLGIDFRKLLILTGEFNVCHFTDNAFPRFLMNWVAQVKALRKVVNAFMRRS